MFGKQESLPVHGGNSRFNNGVSNVPVVNKNVALSIASVAISLIIIVIGIYHCRSNAFTHSLKCTEFECFLFKSISNESIRFKKEDLLDAVAVRIDKAGFYTSDKFRFPVEEGSIIKTAKEVLIATHDMGRRKSRMWASDIDKYIHYRPDGEVDTSKKTKRNRHKDINLEFSRSVTFLGLMLVMFGTASFIGSCYFGQWSEKTRRGRLKKAY